MRRWCLHYVDEETQDLQLKGFYPLDRESIDEIPNLPILLWLSFSLNAILPQNQNNLLFGRKLREIAGSKQNSSQSHTHRILRVEDPKRTWTLQKLPDITPHPLKPNVFCWGCLSKKNQKPQWNRLPKKPHLLPASYASAAAQLGPKDPQAPYTPSWPLLLTSPHHIHRITSCAKQAVYVERMPS